MKEYRVKYVTRDICGEVLMSGQFDKPVIAESADDAVEKVVARIAEVYRERFEEVLPIGNRMYVHSGNADVMEFYTAKRWR